MQHAFDPAVAAVAAALHKAEGPLSVLRCHDTNPHRADWQRWEAAIELTRIVDRARVGVALVRLMDRDGRAVDEDNTRDDTTTGALST
jgi:hypothetical protein